MMNDGFVSVVTTMNCCKEMKEYLDAFEDVDLTIGSGEISGWVVVNKSEIDIYDGWHNLPKLKFNYCSFCGKKLV